VTEWRRKKKTLGETLGWRDWELSTSDWEYDEHTMMKLNWLHQASGLQQ